MPDGDQYDFNFPRTTHVSLLHAREIIVDLFAGGGGASEALRQAVGRDPDIAINHDAAAIGMHAVNHPFTRHLCEDVWHANPRAECGDRPVGWLHASPDCTHFSQAKGGQPRSRATRSLSWVVLKWAGAVRPRIISLENVEQIQKWGPLVAKRDKATRRVVRLDESTAAPRARTPISEQFLVPDKRREGSTWRKFVAALRALGYRVEWRKLRACDYGAGTSRCRLFLIARRDGRPIMWPEQTHGADRLPLVAAAANIDWSIHCPSIFGRKRALADATMRRIARGIKRFVLDAETPFVVSSAAVAPVMTEFANGSRDSIWRANEPLRTQCAGVKGGHFALIAAFIEQANGGGENGNPAPARSACVPLSTITSAGSQQRVVTATLSPRSCAGALRVAAFLINYYGNGQALDIDEPLDTITTRDLIALVTVSIRGRPFVIVDIGLRMLRPRELYRSQGFPVDYVIDRTASGRALTVTEQVRMVGNSVSPPPLAALARANLDISNCAHAKAASAFGCEGL